MVRCAVGTMLSFAINVGVHQGSALSPLLFIFCMETITADLQSPHPWSLLFADDDVFLAKETTCGTPRRSPAVAQTTWRVRLALEKTEYMECGLQTDGTFYVGGVDLNKVQQFKYLRSVICSDGESLLATPFHVNTAWTKWCQVTGVLCNHRMPLCLKSKIYKTVVRPVALYGSESWPMTAKHEQALHVMEM